MKSPLSQQLSSFIKLLQTENNELTNKINNNPDDKKVLIKKLNCINGVITKLYSLCELYED